MFTVNITCCGGNLQLQVHHCSGLHLFISLQVDSLYCGDLTFSYNPTLCPTFTHLLPTWGHNMHRMPYTLGPKEGQSYMPCAFNKYCVQDRYNTTHMQSTKELHFKGALVLSNS